MDINVDKALLKVIRTGDVVVGANRTIDVATNGDAKMVVVSANCPAYIREKIEETDLPVLKYTGSSMDLGTVCGKPYTITAMAIVDAGESDIIGLV